MRQWSSSSALVAAVLVGRVEPDHGLGVADVDGEQHAAQPATPSSQTIFTSNYLTYSRAGGAWRHDRHDLHVDTARVARRPARRKGRLLCKVGVAPRRGRLARGPRVRDRGSVPASRLPAAPGHGRGRPADLPLASRTVRPRVGLHARSLGRRRAGLRRRARGRRRDRARPRMRAIASSGCSSACATGSSRDSRS